MHSKNDNKENKITDKADEIIRELFDSYKVNTKTNWYHSKVVSLYLIMFIY